MSGLGLFAMNETTSAGAYAVFHVSKQTFSPFEYRIDPRLVASAASLILVCHTIFQSILLPKLSSASKFWAQQAWLFNQKQWFGHFWAELRYVRDCRSIVREGYEKYSKKGKTFALPIFSNPSYLILPPDQLRTLLNKPDTEIDEHGVHNEEVRRKYTLRNGANYEPFHFDIVKRELTRKLFLVTEGVYDELGHALRHFWSDNLDEWRTVKVYPSCMRIVSRAANRVFAGPILCRDDEFLEYSKRYSQGVFGTAALISLLPAWMRPILGHLIAYPNRHNRNVCRKRAKSVIEERILQTQAKQANPEYNWEPPSDALQWLVERVIARDEQSEMAAHLICDRVLELNMVAIHLTSIVISNVILDIFTSPNAKEIVSSLQEECERVLAVNGGHWTKAAVNDLVRIDSAIRETMRLNDVGSIGIHRMVVAKHGADFGPHIHVPHGIRVALPSHAIHHDAELYPEPMTYNPFRFSVAREARSAARSDPSGSGHGVETQAALDARSKGLITTTHDFLHFGHGRHACPGRFFAAQEIKLMLAEIVLGYEIQFDGAGRPENKSLGGICVPDAEVEMRVRRRR